MDFTIRTYQKMLKTLLSQGFSFQSMNDFLQNSYNKVIILRHDVDLLPKNSLQTAQIEHDMGIKGSYYFRIVSKSFDKHIISKIAKLDHEIGYHYEDLTLTRGNIEQAIQSFQSNLEKLRTVTPVQTICMHGSPKSPWDSKDLWKSYNYRDYSIIGEPYFDINFDEVFYLTDTGRRWDGWKVSVRDKVPQQEKWNKQGLVFRSTQDIIEACKKNVLPDKIMITTHPQRWTNNPFLWTKELIAQNAKNLIKRYFYVSPKKTTDTG